ncbi:caspase recruitment domain-containing protein 9-like isoform X3 [Patiria miniata]|nr:caspase recruitment domain-containing protein 9-like isoform X3 [Patiria miniata]XP_038064531.1 caspase recruitment domain-containing protein 9-like isoform X3 [Patiria miniata]
MEEENRKMMHQLEIHREVLCNQVNARRLLDRMRSRRIFTKDECEEILNEMVNPSSTTKAGCFLDNLQRKGQSGYNVFLECLGEMHPDLYELLTGHQPVAPVNPSSSVCSYVYKFPNKVGDVIGDLTQEAEELHRNLYFCNQLRIDQERKIKSLNEALEIASKKAGQFDKLKNAKRRAENKVSVLEDDIRTILGNSLRHKEEKDQAMASLREKIKEIHELERRLQQAEDQAEVRRQKWYQTCMDKQQLKVDKEEMLRQMSTMEEELKQAKRNEDVRKSMSYASNELPIDNHSQATINILDEELKNYKEKCEELAGSLLQARNDLHRGDTELEKCKTENEELKQKEKSAIKMAELFKTQYNVTWQELNRVKQQRIKAIDERDKAQMESQTHLAELHQQQEILHAQLQNLQLIHLCQQCSMANTQQVQKFLDAEYTDAVSPIFEEDVSSSNSIDLPPCPRPRVYNIARDVEITDKVRDQVSNKDTFPDESFSYTPSPDESQLDDSTSSYPWFQRHESHTLGDSRKVHPGSMKSPHMLSLWNGSCDSDDEDLDSDDLDSIDSGDEQTNTGRVGKLTSNPYRRSQSWDNLLYNTATSDTMQDTCEPPSKHQPTSAYGSDDKDLKKTQKPTSNPYRRSQSWDNLLYNTATSDTMQDTCEPPSKHQSTRYVI